MDDPQEDEATYQGRETRVDGSAEGEQAGNAFHWRYTRDVPAAGDGSSKVGFDDWFWLQDKRTMIAHASLTKLGVEVATLNAFYQKDIMEDQTPRKRRSISRKEGQQASDNPTKVAKSPSARNVVLKSAPLRKARQAAFTGNHR